MLSSWLGLHSVWFVLLAILTTAVFAVIGFFIIGLVAPAQVQLVQPADNKVTLNLTDKPKQ